MKRIVIDPVLNGFIVQVGCQKVVFESIKKLLIEIERYQKSPSEVEKEYREKAINETLNETVIATQELPPPQPMRTQTAYEAQMSGMANMAGPLGQL